MLKHQIPQIYHHLFSPEVLQMNLVETKATCESCAMSPAKEKGQITYLEHLKCCTFEPYLPNYLIGAILEREPGQMAVMNKINNLEYALPIGLLPSVRYQVEFNRRQPQEFGQREDWLCPYYNRAQNNCGIWRNRGAVCTTFFCKSSYGKKGVSFWNELSDYLSFVEMALMQEALIQLDFSPRQISENLQFINRQEGTAQELQSRALPKGFAKKIWNGYFDDQESFYIKTYQIVQNLGKKEFAEAIGEQGLGLQKKLEKAYSKCR